MKNKATKLFIYLKKILLVGICYTYVSKTEKPNTLIKLWEHCQQYPMWYVEIPVDNLQNYW